MPEDPWAIRESIEQRIAEATSRGEVLSTGLEASYRGFAALIGVTSGRMAEGRREAERALMIGEANSLAGFLAAWSLAVGSHWLGDPRGARRGEAILDTARSSGGPWWPVVANLCPAVDLLRAVRDLDARAAIAARAAVGQVQSSMRWFDLWLVELWALTEFGLLWAEPELALSAFDAHVGLHEPPHSGYPRPLLLRLRAELLLNAGQAGQAEEVLADQEGFGLLNLPKARLLLSLSKWEEVIVSAEADCRSPQVMFADRAQLTAIKAAALLRTGRVELSGQAVQLACAMCHQMESALAFALLPRHLAGQLIELHADHLDDPACGLRALGSAERLGEFRRGYSILPVRPVLTPREQRLLPLLAGARTAEDIAKELFVSVHTVRKQIAMLRAKFDARSRGELITLARRMGYLR